MWMRITGMDDMLSMHINMHVIVIYVQAIKSMSLFVVENGSS